MNRNVLMLSALFVVSYAGLLWLMPRDPREPVLMENALDQVPVTPSYQKNLVAEPSSPEDERLANEYPQTAVAQPAADIEVQETPTSEPVQPVVQSTPLPTIEAAASALRSDSDRSIRLAAVNSLLRLGSRSTVDPTITQALRDASTDPDQIVAAQAGSALIEVERATH